MRLSPDPQPSLAWPALAPMHEVGMSTGPLSIDFSGNRVLVTGGSRGIAGEIARSFARNGADVAVNYCSTADQLAGYPDAAACLIQEMRGFGSSAHAVEADLLRPGEARRLVAEAMSLLGSIDILVLSASVQIHKDFIEMRDEDVAAQLQINLISNIQILQETIPPMRERRRGRIISIGSVQETAPSAEMPIYAMTKAAQDNLVRNLAVENAPYGITVNNVAPGLVKTDRNAFRREDMDAWNRLTAEANPIGRAGLPEDIAPAVLFLASDAASFMTGATLQITGGAHIPRARPSSRPPPLAAWPQFQTGE
jgi:NAD(P)-dependent dehydrogenase (short-subunit alcohol dehydrogenase family)